jgi:hypothetical protein
MVGVHSYGSVKVDNMQVLGLQSSIGTAAYSHAFLLQDMFGAGGDPRTTIAYFSNNTVRTLRGTNELPWSEGLSIEANIANSSKIYTANDHFQATEAISNKSISLTLELDNTRMWGQFTGQGAWGIYALNIANAEGWDGLSVSGTNNGSLLHYGKPLFPITLTVNSATPSIAGLRYAMTNNTSATSITDFTGGIKGQEFIITSAEYNTTIVHNTAKIILKTGANAALSAGAIKTFKKNIYNVWVEL